MIVPRLQNARVPEPCFAQGVSYEIKIFMFNIGFYVFADDPGLGRDL